MQPSVVCLHPVAVAWSASLTHKVMAYGETLTHTHITQPCDCKVMTTHATYVHIASLQEMTENACDTSLHPARVTLLASNNRPLNTG